MQKLHTNCASFSVLKNLLSHPCSIYDSVLFPHVNKKRDVLFIKILNKMNMCKYIIVIIFSYLYDNADEKSYFRNRLWHTVQYYLQLCKVL